MAASIERAIVCTLSLEAVGLLVSGALDLDSQFLGVSWIMGWIPTVVVAARRPRNPTRLDLWLMYMTFPVIFICLTVLWRALPRL